MCTAATYKTKSHYFGRNFDLEFSYHETVTITPRNYSFHFRNGKIIENHYAMIGMAFVVDDYPLYYDATNECGLSMAGLNFPDNAYYHTLDNNKNNVGSFEFIPWILTQCSSIEQVLTLLSKTNIANIDYSSTLKASPLHWIIADKERSITIESVKDGLKIYDNPMGILTNNPPFDMQLFYLSNFMNLSNEQIQNNFHNNLDLKPYSRGMGGMGLPGDLSSASRFVKACFTKMNSLSGSSEKESISQFFHILGSVYQQRGCVHMHDDKYEITIYSSCCNTDLGIYYYTTYENSRITGVDMHQENLDSNKLISYELLKEQDILMQNKR